MREDRKKWMLESLSMGAVLLPFMVFFVGLGIFILSRERVHWLLLLVGWIFILFGVYCTAAIALRGLVIWVTKDKRERIFNCLCEGVYSYLLGIFLEGLGIFILSRETVHWLVLLVGWTITVAGVCSAGLSALYVLGITVRKEERHVWTLHTIALLWHAVALLLCGIFILVGLAGLGILLLSEQRLHWGFFLIAGFGTLCAVGFIVWGGRLGHEFVMRLLFPVRMCLTRCSWDDEQVLVQEGPRIVPRLIKVLQDKDSTVRERAASIQGRIASLESVDPLVETLTNDVAAPARKEAALSLGRIGDTRAIEPLRNSLHDKAWSVRSAVAESLGLLNWKPESGTDQDFLYKIARGEWEMLVEIGRPAAKQLTEALRIAGYAPRAVTTLSKIGDKSALPVLKELKTKLQKWREVSKAVVVSSYYANDYDDHLTHDYEYESEIVPNPDYEAVDHAIRLIKTRGD